MESSANTPDPAGPGFEEIPGGRYEILQTLGAGAHGAVYQARDTFLDRTVAVKSIRLDTSLDEELRQAMNKRFVREAQVAAQLQHPHIVTIYDILFTPNRGFIVMEYIEGTTLQSLLAQRPLPPPRAVDLVSQIARALDYAHDHKVTHRDIKPANIMITPAFEAKITDFGIAKSDGATHLTVSGSLVGTPDYMSPEQAQGEEVDSRTDLFSLGCVLYECLTGRKPFVGPNLTSVLLAIVNSDPLTSDAWQALAPGPELNGVLRRLLAKSTENRFQKASEFLEEMNAVPLGAGDDLADGDGHPLEPLDPPEEPVVESVGDKTLRELQEDRRPLRFTEAVSDALQIINLTPAQGFILSRIDGSSCAADILSVSPIPEGETAATLVDLIDRGLLTWNAPGEEPVPETLGSVSRIAEPETPPEPPESGLPEGRRVEIDRILRLGNERRYSELLGIDIRTPTAEVKKAYLELVHEFHPDAQSFEVTEFDRQKLTQVCVIATAALEAVSPRKAPPPPVAPAEPEVSSDTARIRQRDYASKLFDKAREAYERTDYWDAIQLARQAVELDGENPEYHFLLGKGLMKNQNWIHEAEDSLKRARELDDSNPDYVRELDKFYASQDPVNRLAALADSVESPVPNAS